MLEDWAAMDPMARRWITRAAMTGLVAVTLGALAFGVGGKGCGIGCSSSSSDKQTIYGHRYAIKRNGSCEYIRPIRSDGSLGKVYSIPRDQNHRDLDTTYAGLDHVDVADPSAVVAVFNDDTGECDIRAQPEDIPYKP